MKIGLAIYNFDPRKGGAERYAWDLASSLVRRGHEVNVFCGQGMQAEGINLIKVNAATYPRWLRNLSFAIGHKMLIKAHPVDVMLGFGNTFVADVYQSHGGVQRVWMECEIASYDNPTERMCNAFLLQNSINQRIQEWIAEYPVRNKTCTRIVAISDMVKAHMADHFAIDPARIDVVYNGVDTTKFTPAISKPTGTLKILFSAGNFRLKGLMPLLLALGEVAKERRDFTLTIMGRGRKERYEKMIDDLKIRDCVTFLGEQSSPEAVYRDAHILVHPTFYDACSLTTMEAMASGLPTITTRWNGASALVSENEGYVLDEPYDIDRMASAIKSLFNVEFRTKLGENARKKLESYTMEQNTTAIEEILKQTASRQ